MTTLKKSKKTVKSKFISENLNDFINGSQFVNNTSKIMKPPKRPENLNKDISSNVSNPTVSKKKKINEEIEMCGDSRQKALNVIGHYLNIRKQINENFLKSLSVVLTNFEADNNALKENEEKLEQLTVSFMKCIKQVTATHQQKLQAFKEIHTIFKKESEEMEVNQKADMDKLGNELEEDVNKLKQKLISDIKHNQWETIRRSFSQAMQNEF